MISRPESVVLNTTKDLPPLPLPISVTHTRVTHTVEQQTFTLERRVPFPTDGCVGSGLSGLGQGPQPSRSIISPGRKANIEDEAGQANLIPTPGVGKGSRFEDREEGASEFQSDLKLAPTGSAEPGKDERPMIREDVKRNGVLKYRRMLEREEAVVPPMSIVIFIVGSRGDVQPYIALALALITHAGHRVRIATHPDFRSFVLGANSRLKGKTHNGVELEGRLEFFDAGGNPKELMAYMVKNPGLLPGIESLTNGDIKRKRAMVEEYLRGFHKSTFLPDPVSGKEFAADAIISNPPAFAHVHVAEALGIPLLMSFTMPWTATSAFSHPLINLKKSPADQWATNWMGFHLADVLMWEGLASVINDFRIDHLRLRPIPERTAASVIDNLRIPWTYCWSPELLSKPKDWSTHIDISGFYFLDGEDDFVPPADLVAFLASGPPPVYIGFGSVVISDPAAMTDTIFQAVKSAGVRAIVSAGWAGLGTGRETDDPDIFILSADCPHEWLFANNRVAAVCHHGGAGTTSCGLRHGRPTIIVPFFGDQKFWGDAVHNAGAGPAPIPIKRLTVEKLDTALQFAISAPAIAAAGVLGAKIRAEQGEQKGVKSFTRNMPVVKLRCDVDPRETAVWWCDKFALKLSLKAAAVLVSTQKITFDDLEPYRAKEYDITYRREGPITGVGIRVASILSTTVNAGTQLFEHPVRGGVGIVYGVPEAAVGIVAGLYDGFESLSLMMGSTPRIRRKVTGVGSGLVEGGKAFGLGLWDGITGVFTEPVDGAMREGFAGFGKGLGRGCANLFVRPTAGTLGIVVLPTRGIRASVRTALGRNPEPHSVLRGPREALTRHAINELDAAYTQQLLDTFGTLEKETKRRRRRMKRTQVVLFATKQERAAEKVERQRNAVDRRERKEVERRLKERQAEDRLDAEAKKKAVKERERQDREEKKVLKANARSEKRQEKRDRKVVKQEER